MTCQYFAKLKHLNTLEPTIPLPGNYATNILINAYKDVIHKNLFKTFPPKEALFAYWK